MLNSILSKTKLKVLLPWVNVSQVVSVPTEAIRYPNINYYILIRFRYKAYLRAFY